MPQRPDRQRVHSELKPGPRPDFQPARAADRIGLDPLATGPKPRTPAYPDPRYAALPHVVNRDGSTGDRGEIVLKHLAEQLEIDDTITFDGRTSVVIHILHEAIAVRDDEGLVRILTVRELKRVSDRTMLSAKRAVTPDRDAKQALWDATVDAFLALEASGEVDRTPASIRRVDDRLWDARIQAVKRLKTARGDGERIHLPPFSVCEVLEHVARWERRPLLTIMRGGGDRGD